MAEYIECRRCDSPYCDGCNLNILSKMLHNGKCDRIMDDSHTVNPAADVVEVRRGHWRQNPHCKRIYFCSECGRHIEDGSNNPLEFFPYCHCGAKMDGKSDDDG